LPDEKDLIATLWKIGKRMESIDWRLCRFPGFMEFFSGENSASADRPSNGVKKACARKKDLLLRGQSVF